MKTHKRKRIKIGSRNVAFASLPDDMLRVIAGSATIEDRNCLGLVSKRLWRTLRMDNRHTDRRYIVTDANVERLLLAIRKSPVSLKGTSFVVPVFTLLIQESLPALYASYIRELTITRLAGPYSYHEVDSDQGTMEGALVGLTTAVDLHTLRLNFKYAKIDRAGLRTLGDAPALEVLHLDLQGANIQSDDVIALALAVNNSPRIRVLSMDLTKSEIGIDSARALSMLGGSRTLESLHVELARSGVDTECLEALVTLGGLHTLRLGLDSNSLGGLRLFIPGHGQGMVGDYLSRLARSPQLNALHLDLSNNEITPDDILNLSTMWPAPQQLTLVLKENQLCARSCYALSELSLSPTLQNLTLVLENNIICDVGVQLLRRLKDTPALRSLCLRVGGNLVGDLGVRALVTLSNCRTLDTLELDVSGMWRITDEGIAALSALRDNPLLQTLRLDLRSMERISDAGIGGLTYPPTVRKLHLDLMNNKFMNDGIISLVGSLCLMPLLSDLHLDLSVMIHGLDDDCVESLVALRRMPHLERLHIDLSENRIGERGARALAMLNTAPALQVLKLILRTNRINDSGSWALASLTASPVLKTLHLDLSDNELSKRGAKALAGLYDEGKGDSVLRSLFIDLSNNNLSSRECEWAFEGLKNANHLRFKYACHQIYTTPDTRYTSGANWTQECWWRQMKYNVYIWR
jgi:hypothetical protein